MSGSIYYKDFIADASVVNRAEDYKNLLSRNEEYGGSVVIDIYQRLVF